MDEEELGVVGRPDEGPQGARRPLKAREWLLHRLGATVAAPNGPPGDAYERFAAAAIRDVAGADRPAEAAEFARWFRQHGAAVSSRGAPKGWQLELTAVAWLLERAGVHEAALPRSDIAQLLGEFGATVAAQRQTPFGGWAQGRAALRPGCSPPGLWSKDSTSLGAHQGPVGRRHT